MCQKELNVLYRTTNIEETYFITDFHVYSHRLVPFFLRTENLITKNEIVFKINFQPFLNAKTPRSPPLVIRTPSALIPTEPLLVCVPRDLLATGQSVQQVKYQTIFFHLLIIQILWWYMLIWGVTQIWSCIVYILCLNFLYEYIF